MTNEKDQDQKTTLEQNAPNESEKSIEEKLNIEASPGMAARDANSASQIDMSETSSNHYKGDIANIDSKEILNSDTYQGMQETTPGNAKLMDELKLDISIVIGKTKIPLKKIVTMKTGAIIELENKIGDPVDIYANNMLVAKGEIVMIDNNLGVSILDILKKYK